MQMRTGVEAELEAMKGETKDVVGALNTSKSLVRNILHITPLNPKIWVVLTGNSMIPQDPRGEGVPVDCQDVVPIEAGSTGLSLGAEPCKRRRDKSALANRYSRFPLSHRSFDYGS